MVKSRYSTKISKIILFADCKIKGRKMKNNLFTIIVPIYNAEKYLRECLDSILNQSEQNFDVIMIDDGSKDSSTDIAKSYAEKYPKFFKYFRQENKGLGGARNTGLVYSTGKYSIFLDSDDYIATKTIERLTKFLEKAEIEPDIILTLPYIYNNATKTYLDFYDKDVLNWIFRDENVLNVEKQPYLLSLEASFWRCIWRTDFLRKENLHFYEHTAWEDVPPHFSLFHNANSIMKFADAPTFYYRTNNSGQITSGSGKTRLDVPKVFDDVIKRMKREKWPIEERVEVYKVMHGFIHWSLAVIDDPYRVEMVKLLHKMYKQISWSDLKQYKKRINPPKKYYLMGLFLKSNLTYRILFDRVKTKMLFVSMKRIAKA